MTADSAAQHEPSQYTVTLVGPAGEDERTGLRALLPWPGVEWRRVVLQLDVGSESCPTWTHAAVCLTALQDLLKLGEGFMTDAVVDALKAHMQVVSYETFRGPPR
jgi:hypothetical protein